MFTPLILALVAGYFLGSLPFGYLVARAKGVNIFEVGSKSSGATNVRRVLGNGPGALVLFLDALKGAAAVGWPMFVYSDEVGLGAGLSALVGAVLGHSFSCFTQFKGGKSVATGAGAFFVLFPIGAGIALAVFGIALAIGRVVSLSSMLAAIALPVTAWILDRGTGLTVTCTAIAAFVIFRHRANISRILAGTESKIGKKSQSVQP
jgi:acyl phosphate:glycerol-3-phosphate acyltransferase